MINNKLRKDSEVAAKFTITIFILMRFVAIVIYSIAKMCGNINSNYADNDPYVGFTPTTYYLYEGIISFVSVSIPTVAANTRYKRSSNKSVSLKKIKRNSFIPIVFLGMALCMIAQIIITLIGISFNFLGFDIYRGLDLQIATGTFDLIMNIICTAIIPAIIEEFAYRGFVLGLLKKHGDMFAIFASAFLFGMLHGNFVQIPFAFMVGLIVGYIRVQTNSLLPGILIHFSNNLYAVVITYLNEIIPIQVDAIEICYSVTVVLIGLFAARYLVKNNKEFFTLKDTKSWVVSQNS